MEATEVLAMVGGHVNQELLVRNEYLAAENEILKSKFEKTKSVSIPADRKLKSISKPWFYGFIETHKNVLAACDFFTAEVITPVGLITYYILFFIHVGSRKIHIAGITPNPDENWMKQIARNI